MKLSVTIKGMGWVSPESMGRPGHIRKFDTPEESAGLSGKSVLGTPYKPFGRMDHFSKLGFSAIAFAMADAKISPVKREDSSGRTRETALIAESRSGCIETDRLYQATLSRTGTRLPSPALFAYTLPSCFLGEAAIYYGLTGESYMIEETTGSGLTALDSAMDCLDRGGYESAVCGICNSDPVPGAFFMVLESMASGTQAGPRVITRDENGRFYFETHHISHLAGLVLCNAGQDAHKENI